MSDTLDIFTIYSPDGHAPEGVYHYFNEVMTEVKMRADTFPGEVFHVMQAINEVRMPDEVIEVGDVVKDSQCPKNECELTGLCMLRATLKRNVGAMCVCGVPIERLKLIRKGNVHTFEGVVFKDEPSKGPWMHPDDVEEYLKLLDNGETYKMTLEKEVSDEQ